MQLRIKSPKFSVLHDKVGHVTLALWCVAQFFLPLATRYPGWIATYSGIFLILAFPFLLVFTCCTIAKTAKGPGLVVLIIVALSVWLGFGQAWIHSLETLRCLEQSYQTKISQINS